MSNIVHVSGNIATDITVRQAGTTPVTHFRVAVARPYAKAGEKPKTDFFDVTAWGNTANYLMKYFGKGKGIEVDGALETDSYTDKADRTVYRTYIRATHVSFPPSSGVREEPAPTPISKAAPAPTPAPKAAPASAPAPIASERSEWDNIPLSFEEDDDEI